MIETNKQGSLALVTGASRRIGRAIVEILHEKGFKVAIHYNYSATEALDLVNILNQKRADSAFACQKDLTKPQAAEQLMKEVAKHGLLSLLVNNASIFKTSDLNSTEPREWDALFNANVKAPWALSLACRPYLEKSKGSIINITDIHAESPLKDYAVYCQTKAALVMQTKALAKEFAPLIRVNAIAPGAIAWPEDDNSLSQAKKEKIINQTPLKRHGDPQFIAQALWSLVENPFITGQILAVDGGRSI
ncbi:MAG: pteridine reductase [Proteobacteria bacterium]|nr:pteridine reductase [Pseudomonadota bacterium]